MPPRPPRRPRFRIPAAAALVALALATAGCATVSSLNSAARNLDAFELNPLPPQAGARSGVAAALRRRADGLRARSAATASC